MPQIQLSFNDFIAKGDPRPNPPCYITHERSRQRIASFTKTVNGRYVAWPVGATTPISVNGEHDEWDDSIIVSFSDDDANLIAKWLGRSAGEARTND